MESNDTLDCSIRVKEEPRDVMLSENNCDIIDENQLLPCPRENLTHALRNCDVNHENKLGDKVKIIFECENVKPSVDLLLAVNKIDDDFQYHLQNIKAINGFETRDTIKIKTEDEMKQEFFGEVAEELHLNCQLGEQNRKKSDTTELVSSDNTQNCNNSRNTFPRTKNLKRRHINTILNKKRFTRCRKTLALYSSYASRSSR
ncbi:uncharacterized protein LOC106649654 [Trichogramma pretiosum]|uniref:uncharacterized protein LOC106649654 n=1 Tax=Trichogramma pretiosum TaxID=7493 RepID=UPI0006C99AB6|nr:uncharacterized protein LOC106649654 [Trichogramma pretiosum]